ncbi:MgtC/SapB family protein [Cohnella cellulosilytica]|uniref:MgtC/SapB family protein n=1 Tax=Cohnella cellulosilytica TaxID=986710 RepID=A0ABW2F5E6_9BACL
MDVILNFIMEYGVDAEVWIKLAVAMLLGLVLGMERELKRKPAGLKTSLVITLASCVLTIVSIHAAYEFPKINGVMMDPMRLAAQIVTGVGFLGAGVILKRHHDVISGLTTAAMVWVASAMGVAVGAGFIGESLAAIAFLFVSIKLIPALIRRFGPRSLRRKEMLLELVVLKSTSMTDMIRQLQDRNITIKQMRIGDLAQETCYQLDIEARVDEKTHAAQIYMDSKKMKDVISVRVETI